MDKLAAKVLLVSILLGLVPSCSGSGARSGAVAEHDAFVAELAYLLTETFDEADLSEWAATDAGAWRLEEEHGNAILRLHRDSVYEPPVRSPYNRILVPDLVVRDLVLEARVRSTQADYPHRDVCLFFGYQDPSHFYYVHLGRTADPHANSIFLVDGAPRVSIATARTDGIPWDDAWHTVRVYRFAHDGMIQVYFDDMDEPVMEARDTTFAAGRVGLGSFDDTADFDELRVWGGRAAAGPER